MTLYTLSSDPNDGTVCTGTCLTFWPPLLVAAGGSATGPAGSTGTFGSFVRADGTAQVTHDGRALYYFAHDTAAGQTNGEGIQGVGGVWHVALAARAVATSEPGRDGGTHQRFDRSPDKYEQHRLGRRAGESPGAAPRAPGRGHRDDAHRRRPVPAHAPGVDRGCAFAGGG
jgi:hypothetical protein